MKARERERERERERDCSRYTGKLDASQKIWGQASRNVFVLVVVAV